MGGVIPSPAALAKTANAGPCKGAALHLGGHYFWAIGTEMAGT